MNRAGLTGAHCMDGGGGVAVVQDLSASCARRGELTLRIVKQLPAHSLDAVIAAGIRSGFGDAWLRIGGIKIFADGALGPRTAAMLEPYEGEPDNHGIATIEREELAETVVRCNQQRPGGGDPRHRRPGEPRRLDAFEAASGISLRKPQPQSARKEDGAVSRPRRYCAIASSTPRSSTPTTSRASPNWASSRQCSRFTPRKTCAWPTRTGAGAADCLCVAVDARRRRAAGVRLRLARRDVRSAGRHPRCGDAAQRATARPAPTAGTRSSA